VQGPFFVEIFGVLVKAEQKIFKARLGAEINLKFLRGEI
jgi:hypothetical protein